MPENLKRTSWFAVTVAYASLFAYGLIDNSRGPIFPDLLRDFSLSDGSGALFFSLTSGSALISNISATWWLKHWGPMASLRIFSVFQALSLFAMAFAPSYAFVLAGSIALGVSMGGLGLLVNYMTAHYCPLSVRRQVLSGLHCMYGVSSLLAPVLVTAFFEVGWGWRHVMWAVGVLPLVIVMGSIQRGKAKLDGDEPHVTPSGPKPWRKIAWYSGALPIYVMAEILVSTRLVLFARRELGYEVPEANALLSAFFLALFAGRLLVAVIKVPFSHSRLQLFAIGASLILFCLGLTVLPWALAATGLTMSFYYPVSITRLSEDLGAHSGFAMSWVLTVQAFALLAMHAAVGALSDRYGLRQALWVGPLFLALVLVFLASAEVRRPVS